MTEEKLSLSGLVFETVELELVGNTLRIKLNRPKKKNAINPTMAAEIIYALDYARQERAVRVVVIEAVGDVFSAGADLSSMRGSAEQSRSTVPVRGGLNDIATHLRHLNKPSIASIQGNAYAGALLIVCNVTHAVAADGVTFSTPEIKRGIWPFMVMAGLFRVMQRRAALDFIMRGHIMAVDEAERSGLINRSVPAAQLQTEVSSLAEELASLAPGTMSLGLAAYAAQDGMDFDDALPYLRNQLDECLQSNDAKEGINAFLEKRNPKWD